MKSREIRQRVNILIIARLELTSICVNRGFQNENQTGLQVPGRLNDRTAIVASDRRYLRGDVGNIFCLGGNMIHTILSEAIIQIAQWVDVPPYSSLRDNDKRLVLIHKALKSMQDARIALDDAMPNNAPRRINQPATPPEPVLGPRLFDRQ
jgi:hypothetical protein